MKRKELPCKKANKKHEEINTEYKPLRIKGDPESKGKLEDDIESEIETFLNTIEDCAWWNTKNKGEPHAIGGGKVIRKAGANPGYQDLTVCLRGLHIGIEVKKCGGVQSVYQRQQEDKIKKGKGFYFLVTSVRELIILMRTYGLVKDTIGAF